MANTLKEYKQRRGTLKAQLTRFATYLDRFSENKDEQQLIERANNMKAILHEFNKIQDAIDLLNEGKLTEEERTSESNGQIEFENAYYLQMGRAQRRLDVIRAERTPQPIVQSMIQVQNLHGNMQNANDGDTVGQPNLQQGKNVNIRLPVINLPTFDGKYEAWSEFHDIFKSIIHKNNDLTPIQKLHYLRSSLKDEAIQVIQALETSNQNYEVAWGLLEERYDNPRLITQNHVKAIFEMPAISKESHTQLRSLVDATLKHLRALKVLQEPTEQWDTLMIHIVGSKLDRSTQREWERSIDGTRMPKLDELIKFLKNRCNVLENIHQDVNLASLSKRINSRADNTTKTKTNIVANQTRSRCPVCSEIHYIYACQQFLKLDVKGKEDIVKAKGLCFNCLKPNHLASVCRSGHCRKCTIKHHTLLHPVEAQTYDISNRNTDNSTSSCLHTRISSEVLLSTAIVYIQNAQRDYVKLKCILDSGAQSNFLTERACAKLAITKKRIENLIAVSGFNINVTQLKEHVNATISSGDRRFTTKLNFLLVSVITDELSSRMIDRQRLHIPEHIELADPEFHKPSEIDALIGAELFYELLCIGQIRLEGNNSILLQKTRLGWLITGKIKYSRATTKRSSCHLVRSLEQQVERFWELEQVPGRFHMSNEEKECELHFMQNAARDDSGRYTVRLPFNNKLSELGNNDQNAMRRLVSLERRLVQTEGMKTEYHNFLNEYNTLGHMQETSKTLDNTQGYFIPHNAVFKETSQTTKIRVVFDASAKSDTGVSLNDTLKVGPTVQQDLFSIIARFRTYPFAMTADLEKMYRQVRVHPTDSIHQRILWRADSSSPIKIFELKTLTYGTASAAFLATRCLKQLAIDEGEKFPMAKRALMQDFYVDDVLTGAFELKQALTLRDELVQITQRGGFNPRQWRSNAPELLEELSDNQQDAHICLNNVDTLKTLGVYWNPTDDVLSFRITVDTEGKGNTKRKILSRISTLFDPLRLLGPVIIKAKIILQSLWRYKLGWDEAVPQEIATRWSKYDSALKLLNDYSIPRKVVGNVQGEKQLHCFCDASESAFGACIYLRTIDESEITVRLICSKTRVAPMKQISLPRLELCAALLLTKLYDANINALNIQFSRVCFWSDSTITLSWIKTPPHRLKTFVANRVSEIQEVTQDHEWRHVPSADNPADALSRGQFPHEFVENQVWIQGPDWLQKDEDAWPKNIISKTDIPERKNTVTLLSRTDALEKNIIGIINDFSLLNKVSRIIAYALRFAMYLRTKNLNKGNINSDEMRAALLYMIRIVQIAYFPNEINCLKNKRPIDRNSKLLSLVPFLDDTNLLRVGDRLKHSDLEYDIKHPILLPHNNHLSELLVLETHIKLAHAGAQTTLYAIRQGYWILNGKVYVKKLLRKCVPCFRVKPKFPDHLLGNLPRDRLQCTRPFENVGVDFCGPFFVKEKKLRNRNKVKVYVSVFICLVTKAIHLEIVSDLTTETFIATLKRFFARRGKSRIIYSNNATNFVGTNNKLIELYQFLERNLPHIQSHLMNERITWKFIPPKSPHFGGIWESAVKCFKHHLYRVVGDSLLTFEQFNTFIIEVEAILNSRPLTAMSTDPNDLIALSPAHFLIGTSLTTIPEHDITEVPTNRLSNWEHIQRVKQHFWERWSKEYLNELQQRYKWFIAKENKITIGALVMLKEDNVPPMRWIIGRIVTLHPGDDGIVRVVTVKTNSGLYKRSIRKLALLPIE